MVRAKPKFGNLDPSRFLRRGDSGIASAGRGDPVAPHGCADGDHWRHGAAQARLTTTLLAAAAVALSPVATGADREQHPTSRITAKSRSENNFRTYRHRSARAAFDKDNGSWHRRTTSVVPFSHEGCQSEPRCANSGVLLSAPRKIHHDFPDRPDDRRMIAPAARMISSFPIPATVRIYTFWDDRRQSITTTSSGRSLGHSTCST